MEGYECNAVRGMRRLLARGAVRIASVEYSSVALKVHNCSSTRLGDLMGQYGFGVTTPLPTCAKEAHWFGCDLVMGWGRSPCGWVSVHAPAAHGAVNMASTSTRTQPAKSANQRSIEQELQIQSAREAQSHQECIPKRAGGKAPREAGRTSGSMSGRHGRST